MTDTYSDDGSADDGGDAATPAGRQAVGEGYPGIPIDNTGWRAGAFAQGGGLLGLIKVSNPTTDNAIPAGYSPVGDGSRYMQDAQGNYQFTPAYGRKIHNGQTDWGNVDWPGVALDLGSIAAGSLPLVGAGAVDVLKAMPGMGFDAWRELRHDADPRKTSE